MLVEQDLSGSTHFDPPPPAETHQSARNNTFSCYKLLPLPFRQRDKLLPLPTRQKAVRHVQVGVDVPEASVIIVEHSERFGLAQLHQLRGRVGRGKRASTCYLMTPHKTALTRLQVLTRSQNGFTIAEADLQER